MKFSTLIALLILPITSRADLINGSFFLDFENSTDGTVITTTILDAASHENGSIGAWRTLNGSEEAVTSGAVPRLTIENDASFALYTPVSLSGTFYTGSGGTRGMRAVNVSGENNAIELNFDNPMNSISVGFNFRFNGNSHNWSPRDLVVMNDDDGDFQILQVYDQASGDERPYFQTHFQGGAGNGNDVYFDRNYWYWVTIFRAAASGTMKISFYDATNRTLIGESTGSVSAGTEVCEWITFGTHKYDFDSGQTFDFDNIVINTNGVYPLGPGGGPLIPESRRIDWTNVGVPGGIPNPTTIYATHSTADSVATIQSSLDNCPSNQIVKLLAGTFDLGSTGLRVTKHGVVLEGTNTMATIIKGTAPSQSGIITIDSSYLNGSRSTNNLHSGYTKGSSNIVVSGVNANLKVGMVVTISQDQGSTYVRNDSGSVSGSARTDIGVDDDPDRVLSQCVQIMAIANSTNLTIWPPVNFTLDATKDPEVHVRHTGSANFNYVAMAGIRNLVITNESSSSQSVSYINRGIHCWASNVVSLNCGEYHLLSKRSLRTEVRYSKFIKSHGTASGQGYGLALEYQTCNALITDNVFDELRSSIQVNSGSSGNVVEYNYVETVEPNSGAVFFSPRAFGHHSAHPTMNLFEGNVVGGKWISDYYYGSSSHTTLHRNWIRGASATAYAYQGGSALSIDTTNSFFNIVGNILGDSTLATNAHWTTKVSTNISPRTHDYENEYATFRIGYYSDSDEGGSGKPGGFFWADHIVAGNYDYVSGSQDWHLPTSAEPLSDSYRYSAKPDFFGGCPWPPFDPSNLSALSVTNIPAGFRWLTQSGGGEEGGGTPVTIRGSSRRIGAGFGGFGR